MAKTKWTMKKKKKTKPLKDITSPLKDVEIPKEKKKNDANLVEGKEKEANPVEDKESEMETNTNEENETEERVEDEANEANTRRPYIKLGQRRTQGDDFMDVRGLRSQMDVTSSPDMIKRMVH
ncbi:hypothetical protein Bca52824_018273 [Brassica carinata]|uniref:Uncharacterized protein n=1 Tax=Brassica carinata TaxID=52824 RepID=A0A8X7VPF2_BRACI|nr:hypothetical protein Bca52824_018273 [Brassica carinata]